MMKLVQINLHHSTEMMAVPCQKVVFGKVNIALIQESWIYGSHIRKPTSSGMKNVV
jgi:hypothetical protein